MRAVTFHFVVSLGLGLGLAIPASEPALGQVNLNLDALNAPAEGQTPPANRPARPPAQPGQTTRTTPPRAGTPAARPAATSQVARTPATTTTTPAPTASAPTRGSAAPATAGGAAPGTTGGTIRGAAVGAAAMGAAGTAALILPERAPDVALLAEPGPVASTAQPPPPRPATAADAGSSTTRLANELRVIFAAGKSDLNPDSAATLIAFAKGALSGETISFNVQAYASGPAEDPSAARRLSLARALAIRATLMADGIASTRIYVRAMGSPASMDTEAVDRVDIAILGAAPRAQLGAPPAPSQVRP
ncbi:MAG: hypothetical protein EXR05_02790 [Acetobacteraceae bacterium]|nr:hypothetical protein [Acetobacteraceae bacterium]MSP31152.1 hypothetical protein [Acetobacteraceae bacterium]